MGRNLLKFKGISDDVISNSKVERHNHDFEVSQQLKQWKVFSGSLSFNGLC